jgi:hypothetical protein
MPGIDRNQPIGPSDPITSHRIDQMGEIGSGLAVSTGAQSRARSDKHGVSVAPKQNPQQPVPRAAAWPGKTILFSYAATGNGTAYPSAADLALGIVNAYNNWTDGDNTGLMPRNGDFLFAPSGEAGAFFYLVRTDTTFYGAFSDDDIWAISFWLLGGDTYVDLATNGPIYYAFCVGGDGPIAYQTGE